MEEQQPLSAARAALLEALWELLSPSANDGGEASVPLAALAKAEKGSMIGPHSVSVLKELIAMDANSDGLLSWSELLAYFTGIGSSLSDDEFELVVTDMTQRVQMQLLAESILS